MKCFGKHHCWIQVQNQCVDEQACLMEWGKENIEKIRFLNPNLAKLIELSVGGKK